MSKLSSSILYAAAAALGSSAPAAAQAPASAPTASAPTLPAKPEKQSLTCGYTKRSLKVKPDEAIQDDAIYCCICGKACQTLTERHLASHNGLSREGYLKLCGYPAGQPLMSRKHLERMQANVLKAQQARKAKQDTAQEAPMVKARKKA